MGRVYGAYSSPMQFWERGATFQEYGVTALFVHSGQVDAGLIDTAAAQGAQVYAEFGTFRGDSLLGRYPDVAPIGRDGLPVPKTERFLGACPSHPYLRYEKLVALRTLLRAQPLAGVWLDYLHFHGDFELPDPPLDDSCFCDRCLERFRLATGSAPVGRTTADRAAWIVERTPEAWVRWKCDVIAEFATTARRIMDEELPGARLGIFSAPWQDDEYGGALRGILGVDIDRLHSVADVFSPMVYQVKCGRPVEWVAQYTRWLVERVAALNVRRRRAVEVWPIVEAEGATAPDLEAVLRGALDAGAGGVLFYALPHVARDPEKLAAVQRVYRGLRGP